MVVAGSLFLGRFSSMSETVSGFGAGFACAVCETDPGDTEGASLAPGAGFTSGARGRALLIGGTPDRLAPAGLCSVVPRAAGLFFGVIRSVDSLGAALFSTGASGFRGVFVVDSFRVLARVTMSDLFL